MRATESRQSHSDHWLFACCVALGCCKSVVGIIVLTALLCRSGRMWTLRCASTHCCSVLSQLMVERNTSKRLDSIWRMQLCVCQMKDERCAQSHSLTFKVLDWLISHKTLQIVTAAARYFMDSRVTNMMVRCSEALSVKFSMWNETACHWQFPKAVWQLFVVVWIHNVNLKLCNAL